MLTLAVTSSTAAVGVAVGVAGGSVHDAGERMVHRHLVTDRRHSEELTPLLAAALAEAEASVHDIELFVADVGPGRFTGLRVGLATVRTLALATGRPVVGVSSLEVLAGEYCSALAAEGDGSKHVLAVIDARRAEVFQQRFVDGAALDDAVVGQPDDLLPGPDERIAIVGDGADRYAELYGPGVVPGRQVSAAAMVALAAGRTSSPGQLIEPLYLRDPDVNVNVKTRHTPR